MEITAYEQEARENSIQLLADMNFENLAASVEKNTVTLSLGEAAFKAIIFPGESKDAALILPGEFGNGFDASGAIARAEVARAYIRMYSDIDPSVVVLPNSTIGEDNVNLTLEERKEVVEGSPAPLVGRMHVATEYAIGDQSGHITVGALSQGAYPGPRYAAERDNVALGIVEAPNVKPWGHFELGKAFMTAGPRIKEVIAGNFGEKDELKKELIDKLGIRGQIKYMLGALKEENRSLVFMIKNGDTIENDVKATLDRSGGVVLASSDKSPLSPEALNRVIAQKFENHPRFDSVIGRDGDHSITNDYAFVAAVLRRADELRNISDAQ